MTSRPPGKLQILLVEDAIEEVYLVRSILEKSGLSQVTTSQDGERAARLIRERSFDLIVTDLNLPGIDGYDLIRLIKNEHPELPVLAITAYTANHYTDHAYRAGAKHVLTKPLDRDELLRRVADLVGGGPAAPARPPSVLAIGALPGDVEGGCGGTLLGARRRGDEVLLLLLSSGTEDAAAEAEQNGAELIGARIIVTGTSVSHADDPQEHQLLLERIVREFKPHTALIPSLADHHGDRRQAHRISRAAVGDVPTVLAYETASSTPEFHPTRFVDIGPHLAKKLELLTAYRGSGRPDLEEAYVLAAARHWGRHLDFGVAEAFEVLRDGGKSIA